MIKTFMLPLTTALLLSPFAQSQVCGELFRSTPELEAVLRRPWVKPFGDDAKSFDARGPNQTRLLRAVEADVLGFKSGARGWTSRTMYSLKRAFQIVRMTEAQGDVASVEFHRRRYEREFEKMGLPVIRDLRTRLRENKHYLSLAFSAAANGAVNYLSYRYLNTTGFLVHVPATRIFNERTLPDEVLNELIEAKDREDVPHTRAYVKSKVAFGTDEIIAAARRIFNYGVVAVILTTHFDMITDPAGASLRAMDTTTSQLKRATFETNRETLKLLQTKRAKYIANGDTESLAKADALIIEVQAHAKLQKEQP